jgi:outer membrane protein assembly factor BamB
VGDSVVVGSCSGNFYVLNRHSGELTWRYDIHHDGNQTSFHGDPLLVEKNVAVLGTDLSCAPEGVGHVYAFDVGKKSIKWKHRFATGISTPIVKSGDAIYFGSVHDTWFKADAKTGTTKWEYQTAKTSECAVPRAAIVVRDRLFLIAQDQTVHIVDTASGKLLKRITTAAETALLEYGSKILFGASDNFLYSLDPETLVLNQFMSLDARPTGRMEVAQDRLFLFMKAPKEQGQIAAIDLKARKVLWSQTSEREWSSDMPRLWKGLVLAGNCQGKLAAFSANTGKLIWSDELTGCLRSIGISDDLLYVGAQQGMLYAIRPPIP